MPRPEILPLRGRLESAPESAALIGARARASWREIARCTQLGYATLDGCSVLLRTKDQFSAALALIDLDGVAARIVIAPSDLADEHLKAVVAAAEIDTIVGDFEMPVPDGAAFASLARNRRPYAGAPPARRTEWVMFTSGTTGTPKMAVHDLDSLTGAIDEAQTPGVIWGSFYDIRRYGGLQIFLRAVLGGVSLVLYQNGEPIGDFLVRLGEAGITHLTGTPSHWRRALMSPALAAISPRYIRLSGEIADQTILDGLKRTFPGATIGHAYASTEAGVGFEVIDGLEGFPASFISTSGSVEMKVEDGALHIRSLCTARRFIGFSGVTAVDGFVDTGDMVELSGNRYYFAGRRGGIINVGGLKIHPEEVEAVINRHPGVCISRVSARRNPIMGAIVAADVVLDQDAARDPKTAKAAILASCRANLKPFKVPSSLRFVAALDLTAAGKLARAHA
jgi:acyl-coenzyme A synthetase/AMP-(fatty) acid ligase